MISDKTTGFKHFNDLRVTTRGLLLKQVHMDGFPCPKHSERDGAQLVLQAVLN